MFALSLQNLTPTQFAFAVMILAVIALVVGFLLMWILSWLTATPVRVVRAALKRVEQGDLDCNVVVFDGTELGELQRGLQHHGRRACGNANACGTCSAATSAARWPPPPNSGGPSWAARSATSQ